MADIFHTVVKLPSLLVNAADSGEYSAAARFGFHSCLMEETKVSLKYGTNFTRSVICSRSGSTNSIKKAAITVIGIPHPHFPHRGHRSTVLPKVYYDNYVTVVCLISVSG